MRRIIIMAGLLWSAAAFAQNLNPTVEVTNAYAREASGIEKPSQLLPMPDSITRFNLDFDYAVNETPYQGAYEFTPYLVQLNPSGRPSTEKTLYLRLGAGYSLHPEFAVVWTPVKAGKFRLTLFGDHYSHIGSYHHIALGNGAVFSPDGSARQGLEMRSDAGIDALLNWRSGVFRTDVQYNNILATDVTQGNLMNHVVRASARVQNVPGTTKVDYEAGSRAAFIWAPVGLQEIHTVTDAGLRARLFRQYFKMGLQVETVTQPGGTVGHFTLALPRYSYSGKRFSLVAGVKAAFMLRSDKNFAPTREGHLFPDVQASLALVPDYLSIYLAVTGGNELMSYDSLLSQDSFIAGAEWYTDVKIQRVKAVLGLRGNFGHRFHYDLGGGYSWVDNIGLWAFNPGTYNPSVCYAGPIHTAFAVLDAGWKSRSLDIETHLKYVYTLNTPSPLTPGQVPFIPPAFSGSGKVFWHWGSRVEAGITASGRSSMQSLLGQLPGYIDLGVQGSFQLSSRTGIWAKAGNLLNQAVQRVPFYAEKGVYFSAGFSLNL